ncbi:hypothetical protein, partial [Salmonella sp. M265]|uniref:hypothetical protein n=1 Tax=Salmonella sp. M265 TaxID=3240301 RepID=UPI00352A467C
SDSLPIPDGCRGMQSGRHPHCEPVEAGKGPPWGRGREAGGKVADLSERSVSAPGRSRAGRELDLAAELFGATQPALALFLAGT